MFLAGVGTQAAICLTACSCLLAACAPIPVPPTIQPPVQTVVGAAAAKNEKAARSDKAAPPTNHRRGERVDLIAKAMGTRVVLASHTTATFNRAQILAILKAGHTEILRLEALMTTWREDSEVSRLNAAAGKAAVVVSAETFEVIAKSQWISKRSQGVFDITFASMGKLWRFDEDHVSRVPDRRALAAARKLIDFRQIQLNESERSIKLLRSTTRIGLGGIAKGYAIDKAAAVLSQAGLKSFFAQAGGDLYVRGRKPSGKQWTVGVRDPRGPAKQFFATLPIEDRAFSTAGDYERAFVLDGKRYHHIIDPRTGYPATASRSVTIWAKDALTADAIDDAVFILGPERGLEMVESIPGCGAVIVDAKNRVIVSRRLRGKVNVLRQPSNGT